MTGKHKFVISTAIVSFCCAILISVLFIVKNGWMHTLTALPHLPVKCPKNIASIIVIGQSHASNSGEVRRIPTKNVKSYSFLNGLCYKLRDPIPGTGGRGGSIWPSFVDDFKRPVIIANLSIPGSSIEDWTSPKSISNIRKTIAGMNKIGYHNPIIILMQGETNGMRHTNDVEYYHQLETLFLSAPQKKWLITRESICYELKNKWKQLDYARNRLSSKFSNVEIGPDLDNIPYSMRQKDKCHLTPVGQDILATELSASVKKIINLENN